MVDDEIKKRIISVAKEEFMEKGYLDASMRNISSRAGLTTGSLYNRFKDKEELFNEIVKEKANKLIDIFNVSQEEFSSFDVTFQMKNLKNHVSSSLIRMIDYIYLNYDVFKLIICKSKGSNYESFIELFISVEQNNTTKYINKLLKNGLKTNPVSEDINHMLASSLFNGFFQIVDHDYSKEEAINYVETLHRFFRAGWNELLGINKEQ